MASRTHHRDATAPPPGIALAPAAAPGHDEEQPRPSLRLDAWWLPGLDAADVGSWRTRRFGVDDAIELRAPVLAPGQLGEIMERTAAARDAYLATLPIDRVVASVDRAVSRWLDPYSRWRRMAERALPAITGYSEPMVRKGLPGYLATFRAENLWRLLELELGDPRYLDEFRPRGRLGGRSRAYGPRLTTHVFAGNVPGLPAQSLVCALLAKSACLGKSATEEPLFPALFAASLAEVDPGLGACLAMTGWPGGDEPLETVAFGQAEAVVAYGSEATVESIRRRVPSTTRLVVYGHRLSFGIVGREALAADRLAETALRAAYDAAKYDQQGCLSPHLFYVERGGATSPREFAAALAAAMAAAEQVMPRGRLTVEEASAIRDWRATAEFRGSVSADDDLHASEEGTAWTVA